MRETESNLQKLRQLNGSKESPNKTSPQRVHRSISSSRLNSQRNSVVGDEADLNRKVEFLLKKTKSLELSLNSIKNDVQHLGIEAKESQNLATHLSEIIRLEKHSIAEVKEQVSGVKQKLGYISQKDIIRNRALDRYAESHDPVDIGAISEQIFSRVHREFSKVVDEVVRACVKEQVDFMSKWAKTNSPEPAIDEALRAQMEEMRATQEDLAEALREQKGSSVVKRIFIW